MGCSTAVLVAIRWSLRGGLADLAELTPRAAPSSPRGPPSSPPGAPPSPQDVLPPPRASLASPPSASTALLTSLVLSSDFTLNPGLLDPHLLLDVDGLPLGSFDASSRRQSPRCEDDGDDLSSCALDAIMAAPPTPEAAVDPPVMLFDGIFPDFDDEEEDTARVLRRLRRGSSSSAAKVPREVEADVRLLTKVPLEQSARAIPAAATPAAPAFATPATLARATRRVVHNVLLPRHPERHLEDLVDYPDLKKHVDEWVEAGRPGTFYRYADEHFGGASASASGRCFMDAIRQACYHLDNTTLITEDHWNRFEKIYKREMTYGVKCEDMAEVFSFFERERVPLDYSVLYKTQLSGANQASLNSHQELANFVRDHKLERGCYLVCAGQHQVDHCFDLVVRLGRGRLMVNDSYEEDDDPRCVMETLEHLLWIESVEVIYRIKEGPTPKSSRGRHLKKAEKKRAANQR
ncbi:hypothetical protein PC116_g14863 [Phytophthora cactorum]|nr:hypothetical protein PC114_g12073 [Phytophthora cactorum]KAG3078257.1 hypothetical protein PC122_g12744 [Phytophthora cactorum]KAG4237067.1 hypothetical protein PC116_g14863 [Phytophthora cactorum]